MARIRSVKPSLRTSRVVAQWKFEIRYFWVLLWGYLDDKGRGLDLPKAIAGDCFPLDDKITAAVIGRWLNVMATTKIEEDKDPPLCRYEVGGRRYLHSVYWDEHQRPNRPSPSTHPPCPIHERLTESDSESLMESGNHEAEPVDNSSQESGKGLTEGKLAKKRGHEKVTSRDLDSHPHETDAKKSAPSRASPQVTELRLTESPLSPQVLEFEGLTEGEFEGAAREPITEPPGPSPQDRPPQTNPKTDKPPPKACRDHRDDPDPPACRRCATAREAWQRWHADKRARLDEAPKCRTHRGQLAHNCSGCAADAKAAS